MNNVFNVLNQFSNTIGGLDSDNESVTSTNSDFAPVADDSDLESVANDSDLESVLTDYYEVVEQPLNTDQFEMDNIIADVANMFEENEVIAPVIFSAPVEAPVQVEAPKAPEMTEADKIALLRKLCF